VLEYGHRLSHVSVTFRNDWVHLDRIEAHSSISFLGTRPERPGLEMLGDIPIRIRDGQNAAVLNVLQYGVGYRFPPAPT